MAFGFTQFLINCQELAVFEPAFVFRETGSSIDHKNFINITVVGIGDLASITAPFGQVTSVAVNDGGIITSVTNPSGSGHTFTYLSNDRMTTRTDPNGYTYPPMNCLKPRMKQRIPITWIDS